METFSSLGALLCVQEGGSKQRQLSTLLPSAVPRHAAARLRTMALGLSRTIKVRLRHQRLVQRLGRIHHRVGAGALRVWGMYPTTEGGGSQYEPRIFHKFAGKEAGPGGAGRAFCSLDTLSSDLTAYLEDLKLEGDEVGSMHESAEFASASEGGD